MTALAAGLLSTGLASPAAAAPVGVTTTLTDAAGNAVDGYVVAYKQGPSGTFAPEGRQQVSGGAVNLAVEPGTYKFEFRAEGFLGEYYTDKPSLEAADGVLVSGPATLAPVVLAPAPAMYGVVTNAAGQPLRNVSVVATSESTGIDSADYTDASGAFSIGAEPGSYYVQVVGTTAGGKSYQGEFYNDKSADQADVVVQGAGGTDLGAISLSTGGSITGRVTGAGEAPLERARVTATLITTSGGVSSYSDYSDFTDANGGYSIEGLASGSYHVWFSDPAGEYVDEYAGDTTDFSTSARISVGRGQAIGGIDANLAPVPAVDQNTVDLTGRVVDSVGAPVIGATVFAHSTPAAAKNTVVLAEASTNRQGVYAFTELDPASSGSSEDTFKVEVNDLYDREVGQFDRIDTFYGGARSYDKAKTVTVPAGAKATGADVVLPLVGGISGTVSSEDGLSVARATVSFINEDGVNAGSTGVKLDGTYDLRSLPAGVYKARFSDTGYQLGEDIDEVHVPEWYGDATTVEDAKTITVTAGQLTAGINAALTGSLKAVEKPEIGGKQYIGGTVRANPGVWTLSAGTTFGYEWLIDGAVVSTAEKLPVDRNWFGKKVTLRVSAENGRYEGVALVSSQKLKKQPKIKIKAGTTAAIAVKVAKLKSKKIKGKVVVREIVKTKANGTIKYKKIGKAKVKNGTARVSLAKVKGKGKHELEFAFSFKGKVGNAVIVKKVKRKG